MYLHNLKFKRFHKWTLIQNQFKFEVIHFISTFMVNLRKPKTFKKIILKICNVIVLYYD